MLWDCAIDAGGGGQQHNQRNVHGTGGCQVCVPGSHFQGPVFVFVLFFYGRPVPEKELPGLPAPCRAAFCGVRALVEGLLVAVGLLLPVAQSRHAESGKLGGQN